MKNLVLLGEKRHAVLLPTAGGENDESVSDDVHRISSAAHDPNAGDGDDLGFGGAPAARPSDFLLTRGGTLTAVSSDDVVRWTADLHRAIPELAPSASHDGSVVARGWFDATYVDEADAVACLSRDGHIATVGSSTGDAELIGTFDNGIECGCWSPDREILALFTYSAAENDGGGEKGTEPLRPILMTMNARFEVLCEVTVEDALPSSFAGGAEDVQNGGSERAISVCWRPDGSAIAVSTVDANDSTRRIRTYDREDLQLRSVGRSEDGSGKTVPNLMAEAGIAWASGGCSNLITAVQRKGKRRNAGQQVVFFEPNGLRHREFKLRPEEGSVETVTGLTWNGESDLLAVMLLCNRDDSDGENCCGKVQLWHRSNYHWYLKYELRYTDASVSTVQFDEERPYHLTVAFNVQPHQAAAGLRRLQWRDYDFSWDASTTMVDTASATATVVDGSTLHFTPLDKALVPPPMYAASLTLDAPVVGLTHWPLPGSISSLVYLSDNRLLLLGGREQKDKEGEATSNLLPNYSPPSVVASVDLSSIDLDASSVRSMTLRQFLIVNVGNGANGRSVTLLAISCRSPSCSEDNGGPEQLVEMEFTFRDGERGTVAKTDVIKLGGRVLRMVNWSDTSNVPGYGGALIELADGTLHEYKKPQRNVTGNVLPSDAESMLEPCPWIAAMYGSNDFSSPSDDHQPTSQRLVVGLSSRSRLYCGERLLSNAASSFILSERHRFLSYVTLGSRSHLRFLPLSVLRRFDPLSGSDDDNHLLEGYEQRNVERGSRLVAILPGSPSAVLQLPRGNMEGVYPRALVLPFVMTLIDRGEYGRALDMMRRQKVDLNLLVDMDPMHFLEEGGAERLVDQVHNIDQMNLFLACLFNGDITQWKYPVPSWFHRSERSRTEEVVTAKFDFATKVNQVCIKIRDVMLQAEQSGVTLSGQAVNEGHFLLPILSTFAKESPPQLEKALALIKNNAIEKHAAKTNTRKSPLLSEAAQSSIHYLAFLADYELLFNTALGMYDFDLAKAVARNSQMDPKIYLPLLKSLRSLPDAMARYEVDVRLKRYESALKNLFCAEEERQNVEDNGDETSTGVDATSSDDHFNRCLKFIEEHNLHRLGLELFENRPNRYRTILVSLGEMLLREQKGDSALAIFLAADPKCYGGAKRAARACGDWRTYFACLTEGGDIGEEAENHMMGIAAEIAGEISSGLRGLHGRREGFAYAAQILLDYGRDVVEAVDMLISAEMWSEGRRIGRLNSREDLVKKCVDAAASYGRTCLGDFEDRAAEFEKANERYAVVLNIRRDARRDGDDSTIEGQPDDNGSLFSMASNASNTSLQSNISGSSVGSATSVSSVISAGSVSTFSITGELDVNKHKSKFNKIGREKKKKKKKKLGPAARRRMKLGSEEELKSLISTLKMNCVNDEYYGVIGETITFLAQVGKLSLARELFDGYNLLRSMIDSSQTKRMERAKQEWEDEERKARKEGHHRDHIEIGCEREVDTLCCKALPDNLQRVFSFL